MQAQHLALLKHWTSPVCRDVQVLLFLTANRAVRNACPLAMRTRRLPARVVSQPKGMARPRSSR